MIEEALSDASEALAIASANAGTATSTRIPPPPPLWGALVGQAWRAQADCLRALGKVNEAEEALRQWAEWDPSRRTKARQEIQQLRSTLA